MRKAVFLVLFVLLAGSGVVFAQDRSPEDIIIDFRRPVHYHAGSRVVDKDALGGFGKSDNFPRRITSSGPDFPVNAVSLIALPDVETVLNEKYPGLRLLLVNTTSEEKWFQASDSRLYLVQEARDSDGNWYFIEGFPSSGCGNSRHRVRLGPNEYWEFSAPRYQGDFKTKIRFRLGRTPEEIIYSNEFEGSIDPGQFTNKKYSAGKAQR